MGLSFIDSSLKAKCKCYIWIIDYRVNSLYASYLIIIQVSSYFDRNRKINKSSLSSLLRETIPVVSKIIPCTFQKHLIMYYMYYLQYSFWYIPLVSLKMTSWNSVRFSPLLRFYQPQGYPEMIWCECHWHKLSQNSLLVSCKLKW